MCVNVLIAWMLCALCECLEPAEARRGCWMPWNWTCRLLWATMWLLGSEPQTSARTSVLNHTESDFQDLDLYSMFYKFIIIKLTPKSSYCHVLVIVIWIDFFKNLLVFFFFLFSKISRHGLPMQARLALDSWSQSLRLPNVTGMPGKNLWFFFLMKWKF